MDGKRFDEVAKGLAAGTTRRRFAGGLTGAVAGLVVALTGGGGAAALIGDGEGELRPRRKACGPTSCLLGETCCEFQPTELVTSDYICVSGACPLTGPYGGYLVSAT